MESKPSELITVPRSRKLARRGFLGGSDARIITSADEAPVIRRLWHEQSIHCLGIITANPPRTRAQASKSSTAQAQCPRPIGRNRRRADNRQRQTAGKLVTFLTGIRRLVSANAILWQKLYARLSEYTFDRCNRVLVSRVATHLDIRDRVAMEPGGPSQVPNRSIERSSQSELVQLPQARIANVACDKVRTIIAISPNQGGTE